MASRELLRDAMAAPVEETDLMHGVTKFVPKLGGLLRACSSIERSPGRAIIRVTMRSSLLQRIWQAEAPIGSNVTDGRLRLGDKRVEVGIPEQDTALRQGPIARRIAAREGGPAFHAKFPPARRPQTRWGRRSAGPRPFCASADECDEVADHEVQHRGKERLVASTGATKVLPELSGHLFARGSSHYGQGAKDVQDQQRRHGQGR